mgnify:CR=1 FL=1
MKVKTKPNYQMIVMKFGGTSVGSAERIKSVAALVNDGNKNIVVLSAMSGTTNALVKIAEHLYAKQTEEAKQVINNLEQNYYKVVDELYSTNEYKEKGKELIKQHFDHLRSFTIDLFTIYEERTVLAQGELISTALFHYHLSETGVKSVLLPALNFMRTDRTGEPDIYFIKELLKREVDQYPDDILFITQGYICRNAYGEIDNLKRGGSDYSASLIGEAIGASEIQIWTDIDGFHNNDPRVVDDTKAIHRLSFDEAAELAYFGAKILHPASVLPAQEANIPVRLKNTLEPSADGTLISSDSEGQGIKAIAAKDNITAIKIKSGRMLMAYGFLRKVFEIFESYRTPIDMITTSEIAVSLTIDDTTHLDKILDELRNYGAVETDKNMTIVCIVGNKISEDVNTASKVFNALENIPIRMISYGGSRYNISVLIENNYKKQALEQLSKHLF